MKRRLCVILLFLGSVAIAGASSSHPTLVIHPAAGTGRNPGRMLFEGFERGVTMRLAQVLKERLDGDFDVRISRKAGELVALHHLATCANTQRADCVLSVHVYHHESLKPTIDIYRCVLDPLEHTVRRDNHPHDFIPINQAHRFAGRRSEHYAHALADYLGSEQHRRYFSVRGPFGIPLAPLVGVRAPACAIEIGCCNEESWKSTVDALVEAIKAFYFSGGL